MMHSINFGGLLYSKLSNMFDTDRLWVQTRACTTIGYKQKKLVMLMLIGPRLTGLKGIKNTFNL